MLDNFKFRQFVCKCLTFVKVINDWRIDHIGIYNGVRRLKRTANEASDILLADMIKSGQPFMLGRYGHSEFCCLTQVGNHKRWMRLLSGGGVHARIYSQWANLYREVSKQIDVLTVWNYSFNYSAKKRLMREMPNVKHLVDLNFLEDPFKHNWTQALEGKRVLVINPFAKSIEMQCEKRELIGILPRVKEISIMKPVVSYCEPGQEYDWFGSLEEMKADVESRDFDVALIGCSLYGLPLAAHIKQLGKQAIVMGGVVQLYFGVKGRRWVENPMYKGRFNEHWIFPLEEDIHPKMREIENGCYIG